MNIRDLNLPDHLDLIASAPDGIRKLRGLILELAVRGKLVPQDPNDEPASELLKRIAQERARLEAEGVCKKAKPLPPVGEDEQPFALPAKWIGIRLGVAIDLISGQHLSPDEYSDDLSDPIPYLTGPAEFGERFPNPTRSTKQTRALAISGDILLTVKGSGVGKLNRVSQSHLAISRQLMAVRAITVSSAFIELVLRSAEQDFQNQTVGIAIPGIGRNDVQGLFLSLPPLAEQHRIVAKVDELMALCDQLEAEQTDSASAHARLVDTLLGTLTQSTDNAELSANWQRLAEHFDTLFTTESSLDALKQTILQLAVMGKLVSQDPSDEPASKLLKRIRETRRLKRKCSAIDSENLESPLPEIPSVWIWTVVDQVAADEENAIADGPFGANLKTEHYISDAGYRVVRLQNIGYGDFRGEYHAYVTHERFLSLHKHHVRAGDLVVAGLVDDRIRCCQLPSTIGPALVKADCYRLSVHPEVCSAFALHYMNSRLSSDFAAAHHHGITLTRIGLGNFRQIPFPLPPLAEQHRIVAKVDELLALCDRLKADLADSRARQARLSATLIESALSAA